MHKFYIITETAEMRIELTPQQEAALACLIRETQADTHTPPSVRTMSSDEILLNAIHALIAAQLDAFAEKHSKQLTPSPAPPTRPSHA